MPGGGGGCPGGMLKLQFEWYISLVLEELVNFALVSRMPAGMGPQDLKQKENVFGMKQNLAAFNKQHNSVQSVTTKTCAK